MALKENLKTIRKKIGITQKQLAINSGLSYSMVSKLESGEQNNPSLDTIEKLAKALNISTYELMGFNDIYDEFDYFCKDIVEDINKAQKSSAAFISNCLHQLICSNEATEFFSVNSNAISPEDYEHIKSNVIDYIKYQFSKFNDKKNIYDN